MTEKIKEQILDIRFIDVADMHDINGVRWMAEDLGHSELVEFMNNHLEEYVAYIDTGETDRAFEEAVAKEKIHIPQYFHVAGMMDFHGSVDITDPCYDRDVRCRMNDVKIAEGKYGCFIRKDENAKNPEDANRVLTIGIYLGGNASTRQVFEKIGTIGVDAGLAGFFHNKPDYSDEEWSRLCEEMNGRDTYLEEGCFFSSSGDGDGEYPVFAERNHDGEITSLEIRFFKDDEEEGGED
ncbi:MAG: DUF5049 domain-containing protein [Lachnospiraceae bacterium]|nr:DUF5049 domain-containing protein [Lachnospiraceae bacterium]